MIDVAKLLDQLSERRRFVRITRDKCEELIQQIRQDCEHDCEGVLAEIAVLESQLADYAANNLPDGKRSVQLQNGRIQFRKQAPLITDADGNSPAKSKLVLQFVKHTAPDCLKIEESVNWAKLKGKIAIDGDCVLFADTGEVIDGLHAQIQPDKCIIETMDKL